MDEEIEGSLGFILVKAHIISADVCLVRKEILNADEVVSNTIMTTKQILDGPAHRGDLLPISLDLCSIRPRLTPTMECVAKNFSVRYYVSLHLKDVEGRKYYKQLEIKLYDRPLVNSTSSKLLSQYKLGLIKV